MSAEMTQTAGVMSNANDAARGRMLAARDRVRRWFSPEAMVHFDPDAPEVVGARLPDFPELDAAR